MAHADPLRLTVNGEACELPAGTTVAQVVEHWCPSAAGIAVARNLQVVPRSAWAATPLHTDDRVEIVTAAAGG
jgi:sulfur carrier protein